MKGEKTKNRMTWKTQRLLPFLITALMTTSGLRAEEDLEALFQSPPASARPHVMWQWMNGNISKEGITADLEWMQQTGIAGTLIVNTGAGGLPPGEARFMSGRWLECFNHALQESHRLGLELSVKNGGGWSSSGGPWVRPRDAMKTVTWSETTVTGAAAVRIDLPRPTPFLGSLPDLSTEFYRDIAVYAIESPDVARMTDYKPVITANFADFDAQNLIDGNRQTTVALPDIRQHGRIVINIRFSEPFTARGLSILPQGGRSSLTGRLEMKNADGEWERVVPFLLPFTGENQTLTVRDFDPVTSSEYRFIFDGTTFPGRPSANIAQLELHSEPQIDRWAEKSGFSAKYVRDPLENTSEIEAGTVLDISDHMTPQGRLEWNAPPGRWTILRMGYTLTGKMNHPAPVGGIGLEVDKMSKASLERFFNDGKMKALIDLAGPLVGETLTHVFIDSYETGPQNWTEDFPREFKERRGYDPLPYLPALSGRIVGSREISDRFLWDMRRTYADLFADNYYGHMETLAQQHGLVGLMAETYGHSGNFDNLQSGSRAVMPMGEFWSNTPSGRPWNKEMASVAHIWDRPFTASESFTQARARWDMHPYTLKSYGDEAFSDGINKMYIHASVHEPWVDRWPGMTFGPFGINFERTTTWAEQSRAWIDYLARCQALLQVGNHSADALYFMGEGAPNAMPIGGILEPRLPEGYEYDMIDAEALLTRLSVEDGRILLPNGAAYHVLIMEDTDLMTVKMTRKIRDLVQAGAVVVGPKPVRAPGLTGYPDSDKEVAAIAEEVWGPLNGRDITENTYGKGRVIWGQPMRWVFDSINLAPDCIVASENSEGHDSSIRWIHRRTDSADIYFLAHNGPGINNATARFRISGRAPEIWCAVSGNMEVPAVWNEADGITKVPLNFNPSGSLFVIFRHPASPEWLAAKQASKNVAGDLRRSVSGGVELLARQNGDYTLTRADGTSVSISVSSLPASIRLTGPWTVRFDPQWGGPEQTVFPELISWTDHADKGIRYYSGTAEYSRTFEVPAERLTNGRRLILDLGTVREIAEVMVNGNSQGILWKSPFVLDITDACHAGENSLEIKTVNLWANRLIGDQQHPADVEYAPNGRIAAWPDWLVDGTERPQPERLTFAAWNHYNKDNPLIRSGLLGPVRLHSQAIYPIE